MTSSVPIAPFRMTFMWRYTIAVLVLWVINPELRRLYDWRFGFSPVEVISILPLLALLPHLWSLTVGGGWTRLPRVLGVAAWCWAGAFLYGLVLGVLDDNAIAAAYAFADFVFPVGLGLWVAANGASVREALKPVSRALFAITTLASLYGIVQFISLPPWDAYWLQNQIAQGLQGFGTPEPFHVRVFSVLNSPGPFGNYLALMLIFALPQLSFRRPWLLAQIPIWFIAFGLSLDRSGWLMFLVGLVVYSVFCSRRTATFGTLLVASTLVVGTFVAFPQFSGTEAVNSTISDRIGTLFSLDSDRSARDRQNQYSQGALEVTRAPAGHGIGILGTSAQLGETGSAVVLDSGILALMIQLGIPGFMVFATSCLALMIALLPRSSNRATEGRDMRDLSAMGLAAAVACIAVEISGDVSGILVVILWLFAALGVRATYPVVQGLTVLRRTLHVA